MSRQNYAYDKNGPPPVFHSHGAAYCRDCKRELISTEVLRSGLGIAGGRYMKLCIHDGYQYYNLSADMRKKPPPVIARYYKRKDWIAAYDKNSSQNT